MEDMNNDGKVDVLLGFQQSSTFAVYKGVGNGTFTSPVIVGVNFYAQSMWMEDSANGFACSPAMFSLVSSTGLVLTIQP